jgi:hypothetical protein
MSAGVCGFGDGTARPADAGQVDTAMVALIDDPTVDLEVLRR